MRNNLTEALKKLGYSQKWLYYGFIDEQFLLQQLDAYQISGDKNTEHYRYAAFIAFLKANIILSDEEMHRYIELASIDEDHVMGGSALADLIQCAGISQEQFDHLSNHPAFTATWMQKLFRRINLERQNTT